MTTLRSAESGFSDERGDDTDEEDEAIEGRIRHGPRRRTRKVCANIICLINRINFRKQPFNNIVSINIGKS